MILMQVSTLLLPLHWGKSKTPLLELLHMFMGKIFFKNQNDTSEQKKLVSLTMEWWQ